MALGLSIKFVVFSQPFSPSFFGEDHHAEGEVDALMGCNLSSCPAPWTVHRSSICNILTPL